MIGPVLRTEEAADVRQALGRGPAAAVATLTQLEFELIEVSRREVRAAGRPIIGTILKPAPVRRVAGCAGDHPGGVPGDRGSVEGMNKRLGQHISQQVGPGMAGNQPPADLLKKIELAPVTGETDPDFRGRKHGRTG